MGVDPAGRIGFEGRADDLGTRVVVEHQLVGGVRYAAFEAGHQMVAGPQLDGRGGVVAEQDRRLRLRAGGEQDEGSAGREEPGGVAGNAGEAIGNRMEVSFDVGCP